VKNALRRRIALVKLCRGAEMSALIYPGLQAMLDVKSARHCGGLGIVGSCNGHTSKAAGKELITYLIWC
jgi:hypothetical protein